MPDDLDQQKGYSRNRDLSILMSEVGPQLAETTVAVAKANASAIIRPAEERTKRTRISSVTYLLLVAAVLGTLVWIVIAGKPINAPTASVLCAALGLPVAKTIVDAFKKKDDLTN